MAEIVDCAHGVSEDLGYALRGEKPPWRTEDEWQKIINRDVDSEFIAGFSETVEVFLKKYPEAIQHD